MEASAINTPHPDAAPDDAEAFFGGDDDAVTEPAPEAKADDTLEAKADSTPEAPATEPEPDPATEPESDPQSSTTTPTTGEGNTAANQAREYVVFQRVPLTKRALEHLLKEIEEGRAPEPRVAFLELHRSVARNDRQAVAETYKLRRDQLGESAELTACTARSFRTRRVAPRSRPVQEAFEVS